MATKRKFDNNPHDSLIISLHSYAPDIFAKYENIQQIMRHPYGYGFDAKILLPWDKRQKTICILNEIQLREVILLMMELRSLELFEISDIIRDRLLKIGNISIKKIDLGDQIVEECHFNCNSLLCGRIIKKNIIEQKRISPCPEKYYRQNAKWIYNKKGVPVFIINEKELKSKMEESLREK